MNWVLSDYTLHQRGFKEFKYSVLKTSEKSVRHLHTIIASLQITILLWYGGIYYHIQQPDIQPPRKLVLHFRLYFNRECRAY